MTIFYFTATGNSLAVAKRIGRNLISIPQVIDSLETHYKDDIIGIIFPVYGLAPPKMVQKFLDKVKLEAEYIFVVGTCGYLPDPCMYNLQKRAKKNGYRFDYVNTLRMVDNFLYNFEIGKEIEKLPEKKVEEMIAKIKEDIHNLKPKQATAALGWRAFFVILDTVSKTDKRALRYTVNDQCTKCGT